MPYLTALLTALALYSGSLTAQTTGKRNDSRLIDALVSARSLVVYSDDGAADVTVTENPSPEVKAIVAIRSRALPLLIAHLNDSRPTSAKFKDKPVPVGHICLDILTNIIDAERIQIKDCADDGLGACISDGYYFRPDAFGRKGGRFLASREIARVKANWQRAYQRGEMKFKDPSWWKRRLSGRGFRHESTRS